MLPPLPPQYIRQLVQSKKRPLDVSLANLIILSAALLIQS